MTTHNGLDDEELLVHNWASLAHRDSAADRWPRARRPATDGRS